MTKVDRKFISNLINRYFVLLNEDQLKQVAPLIKEAYLAGFEDAKKVNTATPLQNVSSTKVSKRLPEDRQQPIHKFVYLIEDLLKTQIVNWGKQAKAMQLLQRAGYGDGDIEAVIREMASTDFFKDKGFDLMTVANVIDKIIVRMREKNKRNAWMYTN